MSIKTAFSNDLISTLIGLVSQHQNCIKDNVLAFNRYIPERWLDKLNDLPDQAKHEINALNHHLLQQLKSSDNAFSLGQTEEGGFCVRFGLITKYTDLEELIGLVYTTGKEVEESAKVCPTVDSLL